MSQWDLQANETSMYFKNYVNDEVVEAVQKKFMEGYDTIYVSFDVMGRTRHEQLSYQLGSRLRALYGPKVNIEVDYNYQCDIKWVTDSSQVVEEELSTGASCDLISRSELLSTISNMDFDFGNDTEDIKTIIEMVSEVIKRQPTAYGIDKVVKELEENASRYTKKYTTSYGNNGYRDTKAISVNRAIEIVKQGGTSANYSIQDIDNAIRNKGLLQSE